jgi:5-methylcytosine-specific restriction enzyme subunit McrC
MLSYAFQVLNEQGYKNIATEQFDNTAELCAAILTKGIAFLLKRGLGKEYIPQVETLSTLRGKVEVTDSVKGRTMLKKQLVCSYDDFFYQLLHEQNNQTTAELLYMQTYPKPAKKNFVSSWCISKMLMSLMSTQ